MDRRSLPPYGKDRREHLDLEMKRHRTPSLTEQTTRFMQTLDGEIYGFLRNAAGVRGVTIQGLIRAVIIPNWVGDQQQKLGLVEKKNQLLDKDPSLPFAVSRGISGDVFSFSKQNSARSTSSQSSV